ncbi:hypothetical protein J3E69DRAFT_338485 [Trichoderma sp. SZMC 28015]
MQLSGHRRLFNCSPKGWRLPISSPPPSAARGPATIGSTSPNPTSHFPALVPHPQMSKPSQQAKDSRLVGRLGEPG